MERKMPRRFWVETALAVASSVGLVLTLVWKDWIEIVFRVDPDNHSGSLESLIVVLFAMITIASGILARYEWRRTRPAVDGV